jgi:SM-20-related protein
VRTDAIRWLGPDDPAEAAYLAWMERLRLGLNRRLFIGLFEYEAHFAVYDTGAYYRKHLDAFQGESNRVLTTVFYLNPQWRHEDGGELLVYGLDDGLLESVMPAFGTLAIFLSTRHPHEVAETRRKRYSIAGWFRINNSLAA